MAATLSPSTLTLPVATLLLALHSLTPGSVAHSLLLGSVPAAVADEYWDDVSDEAAFQDAARAEYATERWFEDRGYWDARAQEDHEARMGIPA
jgi:hypothetical protein